MVGAPVILVFAPHAVRLTAQVTPTEAPRELDCRWHLSDDALHELINRERPDIIVSFGAREHYPQLNAAPYQIRRRWLHFDVPGGVPAKDELERYGSLAYVYFLRRALARANEGASSQVLVSVFTPAFRSGDHILRAYRSLQAQTFSNWEWVIVDDSDDDGLTWRALCDLARTDSRIAVHASNHHSGRIGEVKRRACALSHGDILVELDHDDELTPDALACTVEAFAGRPSVGFVYSDWAEIDETLGTSRQYSPGWGFGYGRYRTERYEGRDLHVAVAPPINGATIRHIGSTPNHLRAWRRSAYWECGGHNPALAIADDYELMVRTFLHTEMWHMPMLGYIQYFRGDRNAQVRRRAEIQELVAAVANHYERQIAARVSQLGLTDEFGSGGAACADLSVIVLDATAAPAATGCLESVRRFCPGAEVILVGNGVPSRARHLADEYVELEGNVGVSAAWNFAASRATRSLLCFMNDDAAFVDETTPARLMAAARAGVIAGPFSDRAKAPQGNVGRHDVPADDIRVAAVVGVCLVVTRDLYQQLGGFETRLLTWEDDDFCFRAKRFGVASAVIGGTWVSHAGHATFTALGLNLGAITEMNRRRFDQIRPAIAVAAIAKDEENAVGGYFEQFRPLWHTRYLLDTGSSDQTVTIAQRYGAEVVATDTIERGGFADARNVATDLATAEAADPWIVMLDPDERLDRATIAAIPELIASAGHRFDQFLAPLDAVSADGSRRAFVPKPFLYRAGTCRWRYLVHEKLVGGRAALVANARIEHCLPLHSDERRQEAEALYGRLATREPYFVDAHFREQERRDWPILDYDRLDDPRISKVLGGPLVSVIIPTFERAELCTRAIMSALDQDWAALEVIVVGDACPHLDGILRAFSGEPRVRGFNLARNHGAGGAVPRNFGALAAAGPWLAYLDDDNVWDADHVSSVMAAIGQAGASWGFSSMRIAGGDVLDFITPERGSIDTSCLILAKRLLSVVGPWKSRSDAGDYAHDWEFVSRIVAAGEPWAATRRATLHYNLETSGQAAYLRSRARATTNPPAPARSTSPR